ncbi:hypothetical protein G3I60_08585 [Streptomyces sp. SID13666]|uniref:hypothetical protein n=1 Tax=unclassified Streptomyces TaxID=2593676 RepID=UPI0013C100CB|nr:MULTISPECIES: hypothetical protein [unclassified Streptomyces]NEA54210.1 hypothetical protein [Streptomyces sp. SID13666]NEA70305.1 hypothetical protein [Streptomyces sp. SID13588]
MEDPSFTVWLTESGNGGQDALRAVMALAGLSPWHSKLLLKSAPATVLEDIPFDAATDAVRRLQQAGVHATAQCTWCDRTVPGDGTPLDPSPCASRFWPAAHCRANSLVTCGCDFCTTHWPLVTGDLPTTR